MTRKEAMALVAALRRAGRRGIYAYRTADGWALAHTTGPVTFTKKGGDLAYHCTRAF